MRKNDKKKKNKKWKTNKEKGYHQSIILFYHAYHIYNSILNDTQPESLNYNKEAYEIYFNPPK